MKSKWLSELKKIGFLRLGLLAVAAIILIICSLPQNQLSNLNQAGTYSNQAQSMGSSLDTDVIHLYFLMSMSLKNVWNKSLEEWKASHLLM